MPFEIPLTNDPSQKLELELNGIRYFLSVQFNFNSGIWLFKIADSEEQPIIEGLPLTLGNNILEPFVDVERLLGQFWMVDEREQDQDADSETLGSDVKLIYYPPGDTPIVPEVGGPFTPFENGFFR
jgi:hypothetical protein